MNTSPIKLEPQPTSVANAVHQKADQLLTEASTLLAPSFSPGQYIYVFPFSTIDCNYQLYSYCGYYWDNRLDLVFERMGKPDVDGKPHYECINWIILKTQTYFLTRREAEQHRLSIKIKELEDRIVQYHNAVAQGELPIRTDISELDTWHNGDRPTPLDYVSKLDPTKPAYSSVRLHKQKPKNKLKASANKLVQKRDLLLLENFIMGKVPYQKIRRVLQAFNRLADLEPVLNDLRTRVNEELYIERRWAKLKAAAGDLATLVEQRKRLELRLVQEVPAPELIRQFMRVDYNVDRLVNENNYYKQLTVSAIVKSILQLKKQYPKLTAVRFPSEKGFRQAKSLAADHALLEEVLELFS